MVITPPSNSGVPTLTDYYILWTNNVTKKFGKLGDDRNNGLIGLAGLNQKNIYSEFKIKHDSLEPGTDYTYIVAAVSINDKVWRYNSNTQLNGRPVGMSDIEQVSSKTLYSVPLGIPKLETKRLPIFLYNSILNI